MRPSSTNGFLTKCYTVKKVNRNLKIIGKFQFIQWYNPCPARENLKLPTQTWNFPQERPEYFTPQDGTTFWQSL
jgi:hypothetical protein